MLRRAFLQGLASLPFVRRFIQPKKSGSKIYKDIAVYIGGEKIAPAHALAWKDGPFFAEGVVSPSPADYKTILLGKLDPYERVYSPRPIFVKISEVK